MEASLRRVDTLPLFAQPRTECSVWSLKGEEKGLTAGMGAESKEADSNGPWLSVR